MNTRIEKVNSLLQQEIGKIILRDFAFSPEILVTLTRVDTTGNLFEASAYVSVFPEIKAEGIINALNKSVHDIQYKVNRILKMRPVPRIKFVRETEISKAARVEELLAKAEAENKEVEKSAEIE